MQFLVDTPVVLALGKDIKVIRNIITVFVKQNTQNNETSTKQ